MCWESVMSRVRFQLLFIPPSTRANWSGTNDDTKIDAGERYSWRLMGANNRELGRSAQHYESYAGARRAVGELQRHADRLVCTTLVDRGTGRWGWRIDLDGGTVAVSGRSYERDHDSRLGMDKFLGLLSEADLLDAVVALRDRRRSRS
jgi:hypothetical protein